MQPLFRHRTFDGPSGCGTEIAVYETFMSISALNHLGRTLNEAQAPALKGPDAVALARAVLAAAGNTGHRVVHEADLLGAQNAVVAMRQRAALIAEHADSAGFAAEAIRALPLVPDGDDTTTEPTLCAAPCPHGHTHTCARSPKHCGFHRDVKQKGDASCSWTAT